MMGHLLGAAGAVEAAVCIKAIGTHVIPPTVNLEDPDPEIALDFVPLAARERRIRYAMSNSFGFGGTNATLILADFEA
jgi:3-oxoacyl-[acyl-carrier-protein] synthase II